MPYLVELSTHVSSRHANLLKHKKVFTYEKSEEGTPKGVVWYTNMAAVS